MLSGSSPSPSKSLSGETEGEVWDEIYLLSPCGSGRVDFRPSSRAGSGPSEPNPPRPGCLGRTGPNRPEA